MYKSVIIGVGGGRAHGHADAYQYVKRGRVTAVCDYTARTAGRVRRQV